MLDERKEGDPLEGARVMLTGTCSQKSDSSAASSYLRRHPAAKAFANFADFAFYRMEITRAHLVAGFGRIVDLKPALDGTVKTVSRPIGAWTADWHDLAHNHEVRWPYVFVSAYADG